MARRHKRRPEAAPDEIERFLAVATACHREIVSTSFQLDPHGAHYRALGDLNEAICGSIRTLTGSEPPWAQVAPASSQAQKGWRDKGA